MKIIYTPFDELDKWDRDYINIDEYALEKLINGANFLDIKSLLSLGCKKVAQIIKGKSVEEINLIKSSTWGRSRF